MKVRCPDCGSKGLLNAELAGELVRCSRCGSKFVAREVASADDVNIKWYYAEGDHKKGPFSADEFTRLVNAGTVASQTLVWRKGMSGWQTLEKTGEEQGGVHVVSRQVGSESAARAGLRPGMAETVEKQKISAGSVGGLLYAGGFKRLFAKIIDLVFMAALATLVDGLSRKLFPAAPGSAELIDKVYLATMLIDMLLGMIYITWFVGKFGATPGKMVFSLKVVTQSGGKVGYGQAFGRYWAEFVVVWLLTLMLGYLPILFDPQRRGLHDRLCKTRVVHI